jgi:DUF1009 family protein
MSAPPPGTLGIIAGGGELPRAIAQSAAAQGRKVHVLAIKGCADEGWPSSYDHAWIGIGEWGHAVKFLGQAGVTDVLLAGRVDRPSWSEIKVDAKGLLNLPAVIAAARKGDDALLKFISDFYAKEGFRVLTAAEAAPELVMGEGALGKLRPDPDQMEDIARAFAIIRAMGALDVGQAAIVCDGLPLCVEAAEGTDAMIARVASLRANLRGTAEKRRGVLAKALKPMQDRKTDLPVIGVGTVKNAHAVHLAGIALEAGSSLIVDKGAVAAEADRLGLFVVGVSP